MEQQRQQTRETCEQTLSLSESQPLSLQTLASIRSQFINNPNASDSTLTSLIHTLITTHSLHHHNTLKLLADLSVVRNRHFSRLLFDSLTSGSLLTSDSPRLSADCIAALVSISDCDSDLAFKLDGRLFVSLCFASCVSARRWLLRNAERLGVESQVLFTVLLGFTKDPFPHVRRVALEGLAGLCRSGVVFDDVEVIRGCYCRAVELLRDAEDCVRCAAVDVVREWGKMLVAGSQEKDRTTWSDSVFIQICSMVRDMSMEVRIAAFDALLNVGFVSEDILLQTLSKKVLGIFKDRKVHSQCHEECYEILPSAAAGAFLHGLEDEYYEVRKSACSALRSFTVLSDKFAGEALNLLVNMVNDDSVAVRLQSLDTMLQMANFDCLKLQVMHMHMFLGTLVDLCGHVRSASRKILKLVQLSKLNLFRLVMDSLLENLQMYPLDEADIFHVLFYLGQSHGNFSSRIIEEVSRELEPDSGGKMGFDTARIAAFLVLAISIPLSCEQNVNCISPRIFSYAVSLLGRISHSISDFMSQDSLLAYLSHCSRLSSFSDAVFLRECTVQTETDGSDYSSTAVEIPSREIVDMTSETKSSIRSKLRELATSEGRCNLGVNDEMIKSIHHILAKVESTWSLVQSGYTNEVLKILGICKEEILSFNNEYIKSDSALAFTLQYLQVVKLLTKVSPHFMPRKKISCIDPGQVEILLGKLDSRLREMRYRFIGLSKEDESHVLELLILTCLLKLSKVEIHSYTSTIKKLALTISQVECINKEASIDSSEFVTAVNKLSPEIGRSSFSTSFNPSLFRQLLLSFSLKKLTISKNLKHINAELDVPNNSSENPLVFVPGLPVAIPLHITLQNISRENRLWLRLTGDASTQFIHLDPDIFGDYSEVQKFTYNAPFYLTPKVVSLSLKVVIGVECVYEEGSFLQGHGGPKYELTYLCREREVHLSMVHRH